MVATTVELSKTLADFVELLGHGISVEAVILYGSYAQGAPHEWSDIDLAVVSPDFEGVRLPKRQETIARLSVHADPRISTIGYPSSEYHNPGRHSFLGEIIRTGRVVYCADEPPSLDAAH